jgi:hypothetical protein
VRSDRDGCSESPLWDCADFPAGRAERESGIRKEIRLLGFGGMARQTSELFSRNVLIFESEKIIRLSHPSQIPPVRMR